LAAARTRDGPRIRGRGRKRIQVDGDEVHQAEAEAFEGGEIVGAIAARENAAVNRRVQRLDAAVHHLGKPGEVGDGTRGEAGVGQRPRSSAGRHQLEAPGGEAACEFCNARLVRKAEQGSWHMGQSSVLSSRRRAGLAPKGKGRTTRPFFLLRQRLPGLVQ
jgi:hypothetical protein